MLHGSDFDRGLAVSLFQDAAEIVSRAALTACGVGPKDSFLGFWDQMAQSQQPSPRDQLPMNGEMKRLNRARVDFKHYGNPPSDVKGFRHDCHSFLVAVFRDFLNVDFTSLSSADLILHEKMKEAVKRAEEALNNHDIKGCLERCSDAMDAADDSKYEVGSPGIDVEFINLDENVRRAIKLETGNLWTHLRHVRDMAFAGFLGMNLVEFMILSAVIPRKSGSSYVFSKGALEATTEAHARICVRLVTEYCMKLSERLVSSFDDVET